jgi:hypothetical protein
MLHDVYVVNVCLRKGPVHLIQALVMHGTCYGLWTCCLQGCAVG